MNLYTSYGTYGFLNQIQINNPDHNLFQYSASDTSVILEETEGKSVLKHPSAYEVLYSVGEFNEEHFYSALFIPSSEDHKNQLENTKINL